MTTSKHEDQTKKWWAALSPEARAELRRLDGQALTARTKELVEDVDGRPLGFELGEPKTGVFYLLVDDDDDEDEEEER